jgi:hypothetical protein
MRKYELNQRKNLKKSVLSVSKAHEKVFLKIQIRGIMESFNHPITHYDTTQNWAAEMADYWRQRLLRDYPELSDATRESIIRWLLGQDLGGFKTLEQYHFEFTPQVTEYRYRILNKRYLGMSQQQAYLNLMNCLRSVIRLRNQIRALISVSRDRQRTELDVLQEVICELMQSDRYIQLQMQWIAECTTDTKLKNALIFTIIEEYCLRPIRNKPLLLYRVINYLRRNYRGGLTGVPLKKSIRLVSDEIVSDKHDDSVSLADKQAIEKYPQQQQWEEQLELLTEVKEELTHYLASHLGDIAVQWLELYLQGCSPRVIATSLNLSVQQVYRLREKVIYHAKSVFAAKLQPELVDNWLAS